MVGGCTITGGMVPTGGGLDTGGPVMTDWRARISSASRVGIMDQTFQIMEKAGGLYGPTSAQRREWPGPRPCVVSAHGLPAGQ
jgi:hypothetical protein